MIGMVLADLYTAISGIGYLIVRTASTFQVDKMFVPIVTLGLLGVTLTALLRLAETIRRAVDRGVAGRLELAHVPEKWEPVFRKGHAPINIRRTDNPIGMRT